MKLGEFKDLHEALAALEQVIPKAQWGKKWIPESEAAPTATEFVAGRTGDWINITAIAIPKSDGSMHYDGLASHYSGLIIRLPLALAEYAVKTAKRKLYGEKT